MAKLAIHGGRPVRAKSKKWPIWPFHTKEDVKLLNDITASDRWSYEGPVEDKFTKAFTKYQTAKYGHCNANGTVGLQLALEALDIGYGDEVIVPGMTWQATAAAVLDVNAVPILADVEPDTWCLDLAQVEANINRRTKAVIVVHLYGSMTDLTKLKSLCKKKGLYLIEDCAHQHGAFWKGKGVGSIGDVGSFSFQESKVLSSGEGGFNTTNNKKIHERLYSLKNCGRGWQEDMTNAIQSGNYRITEWQAGILLNGLKRLDKQVKLRDKNAQYLNGLLEQIPGVNPMRRRKQITQASYFNYAFRLDWKQLGVRGITNLHICDALTAELGTAVEVPYQPLNACELYQPRTKKRYKLSAAHWKAINPKRFKLPVSTDAHFKSGVSVHHKALLGTKGDMDDFATAVAKVVENIKVLAEKSPDSKWNARKGGPVAED
jgi:L-glutamine:2-deoxy-scyllo-inosose/3-amino-2,3-dideoxy-scyllo-inosose aminotransferase